MAGGPNEPPPIDEMHLEVGGMIRKKAVIAVHPNTEMYGSDRMFLASAIALHGRSNISLLTILPGDGPLVDQLKQQGIACARWPFPVLRRREVRGLRAAYMVVNTMICAVRFAVWLRRARVDALYVSTVICPVWVIAGRLAGVRVVVHVHEHEPNMSIWAAKVLLAQLWITDAIAANSHATRRWIADSGVTVERLTEVIYNGVELLPSVGMSHVWRDSSRHHLVLVGRLAFRKGQDVAVEALAELRRRGFDVGLTLVGSHYPGYEPYVDGLRRRVAHLGLTSRVDFAGFVEDPFPLFRQADVVIVPSRVEPFGNVAVEALSVGCPVVVSAVQGLSEIVEDGKTGLMAIPGDAADLAVKVATLLEDTALAATIGEAGRRFAASRFGIATYRMEIVGLVMGKADVPHISAVVSRPFAVTLRRIRTGGAAWLPRSLRRFRSRQELSNRS